MDDEYDKADDEQGGLRQNDPYRGMERKDIRPDFLSSVTGNKSKGKLGKKESGKSEGKEPKNKLGSAEKAAIGGGLYNRGATADEREKNPNGFTYNGTGKNSSKKTKGSFKIAKMSAGTVVALIVCIIGAIVVFLNTPIFHIGSIDFNLMDALGFLGTVGILEKQAEYVIGDDMAHGEVPDALAGKLAEHGLMIGQVASNGDFVRTNTYVANVDDLKDLAVLGNFQVQPSNGELALLYDDKVVMAREFADVVESNPMMYADYSDALDIGALYYYGEDASDEIKNSGGNRSLFYEWKESGDKEKNMENFNKLLEKGLNKDFDITLGGFLNDGSADATSKVDEDGTIMATESYNTRQAANQLDTENDMVLSVRTDRVQDQDENKEENVPSVTPEVKEDLQEQYPTEESSGTSSGTESTSTANGFNVSVSGDDADGVIESVTSEVKDDSKSSATRKAGQLLNVAVSSSMPYHGVSSFLTIESCLQQTRINGDGPANECMELLYKEKEVKYTDASTGKTAKKKASIITTPNFVAAVSAGKFSKTEAKNFSQDAALNIVSDKLAVIEGDGFKTAVSGKNREEMVLSASSNSGVIGGTTIATEGQKKTNAVLKVGTAEDPDDDTLKSLSALVDIAMVHDYSELFPSYIGGELTTEGGSFLNYAINRRAVGAMPADNAEIARYHQEVKEVLARKAEADRATKSPFDISSPHTFMGSIVRNLSNAIIKSRVTAGGASIIGTIASATGDSVKNLAGDVIADGNDDSFEMTHGSNCDTAKAAANVEGDIYCTPKRVISTGYMKRGKDDWKNIDDDEYEEFVEYAMDRQATVGVKSGDVCEKYDNENGKGFLGSLADFFGLYSVCDGTDGDDPGIATGAKYTLSSDNSYADKTAKLGGYALYDQVSSLLEGKTSKATQILDEYYAKHPKDNSREGIIARRSGLTKSEVRQALAYADYLTEIARYNPATRYVFGGLVVEKPEQPLVEHANKVSVDLYALWHGRTEYDDLRGRIRVG